MDRLFENKWAIRVMALIFAVSLYLYVGIESGNSATNDSSVIPSPDDSSEVQVLEDVPLDVKIDDEYVVSGVPDVVSVSLEGKTRVLTPVVRQRNFNVFIDLRDLPEGENTVDIEYENIPEDLNVFIEPKSIDVQIEKRATKEFSVDIDIVNMDKLPLGYEIGEAEIEPEKVTVVSSKEVIDQVAMVKVYVDATDMKESISNKEVPVSVYDIQGNDLNVKVEPEVVTLSVSVERPSKKVPLSVETKNDLPAGLSLENLEADKEIEIFGNKNLLSDIERITTEDVDLSKVTSSGDYEVEIAFPEGVTANEMTTSIDIELEETTTFDDISLGIEGMEKEDVTFDTPENGLISVIATGSDQAISKLLRKDITGTIKLNDLDTGKHKVAVEVDGPEAIQLEPEPKEVTIDID